MKRLLIKTVIMFFVVIFSGCGSMGPSTPTSEPISIESLQGAQGIAVDASFGYIFSNPIDTSTITPDTVFLTGPISLGSTPITLNSTDCAPDNPNKIPSSLEIPSKTTCILTPIYNLDSESTYVLCMTTDIKYEDPVGETPNFEGVATTFTTADVIAPTVTSVSPTNGSTAVPVNSTIQATFSEPMNTNTITSSTFYISTSGANINGTISYVTGTNTSVFTPAANLTSSATYTATLTTGITDDSDNANPLASNYTWTFTAADILAPTVSSTSPSSDATNVLIDSDIDVTFSEAMDDTTITTSSFSIATLAGSVSTSSDTSTYSPSTDMTYGTTYTATLTTDIADLVGNTLASNYSWSFRAARPYWLLLFETGFASDDDDQLSTIAETTDNGYIASGYTESYGAGDKDGLIIKTEINGTLDWAKAYGGANNDTFFDIILTDDGGYIAIGATNSYGAGNQDMWIVKLDSSGDIEWEKAYGGANYDYGISIIQTAAGGYVAGGITKSDGAGNYDYWILLLSSTGTINTEKAYGGANDEIIRQVNASGTQNIIVGGYTASFGAGSNDIWVLKLALLDGSVSWEKTYGTADNDKGTSAETTSDLGYIISAQSTRGATSVDVWLLKLETDGAIDWEYAYAKGGQDYTNTAKQTIDGGYIVNTYLGAQSTWLLKLNSSGSIVWEYMYANTYDTEGGYANSVLEASDGAFVWATTSFSRGTTDGDPFLGRVNSSGENGVDSCSEIVAISATATATSATVTDTSATVTSTSATVTATTATVTSIVDAGSTSICSGSD